MQAIMRAYESAEYIDGIIANLENFYGTLDRTDRNVRNYYDMQSALRGCGSIKTLYNSTTDSWVTGYMMSASQTLSKRSRSDIGDGTWIYSEYVNGYGRSQAETEINELGGDYCQREVVYSSLFASVLVHMNADENWQPEKMCVAPRAPDGYLDAQGEIYVDNYGGLDSQCGDPSFYKNPQKVDNPVVYQEC